MKMVKLSRASRSLAEYAAELTDEIVVVTVRDRPVAALVPLRRVDPESVRLSAHPEFLKIVRRSRADFRRGRTIPLAEMKASFAGGSPDTRVQPTKTRRALAPRRRAGQPRRRGLRETGL